MASSEDKCTIRDVHLRSGQLGPVLVNFEHGHLKEGETLGLSCGVFTPEDNSKICTVAAVAKEGDVVYQGDILQDGKNLCRTFLAVRNKRKNKMRIYETSQVMLSPSVASNVLNSEDVQDKKQAVYNLSYAFGSKRVKRIADQRARMEVNVDSVKDKLSTTVNDIKVSDINMSSVVDDSLNTLLPTCFREAKTPAEVYPISALLKNKEIHSLESYYSKALESGTFNTSDMSPFYKHMVKSIASGNTRAIAFLLYAESLVQFCNLQPKQISAKGACFCRFSAMIHKRIYKDFTTNISDNISRSQFLTDKAVMFIIILSLHIGGFQLDLDIIARSVIHMDIGRIKMLARIIGTVPVKTPGASKTSVILKVPLPPLKTLPYIQARKGRR